MEPFKVLFLAVYLLFFFYCEAPEMWPKRPIYSPEGTTKITMSIHLWTFPSKEPTHPNEQLCDDHIGHCAGQVQSGASVSIPVGLVNLLLGAVCQQHHHQPQVILHHRPKQLLPQGHVWLGQPHQKQLLLVLRSDPALLLLPGEKEVTRTLRPGRVEHAMSNLAPTLRNVQCIAHHSEAVIWRQALCWS